MPTRRGVLLAAVIVVLFFIANRAAYEGYFSGDDIDNIDWTSRAGSAIFVRGLTTPLFNPDNFRPVGHAVFWLLGPVADLHFAPYLATVQILHLVVAFLIFLLAGSLGTSALASTIGALFFVFHMALFGAFWKPMYVFDVLCALFCCLSVLAWRREEFGWSIASFCCFWLAYKSKEVAVMLPAVLAVFEYASGTRRWLRILPFLGVSLVFGGQAILHSFLAAMQSQEGPYQLRLTPQTLASTITFYGEHLFLSPWGVILLAPLLFFARNRIGAMAALLFIVPMLALPGRTFSVYLYVPLAFLSLTVASAAERSVKVAMPVLAAWLGLNFVEMRHLRSAALAEAQDARDYVDVLESNKAALSRVAQLKFDGYPPQLSSWGVEAAARQVAGTRSPATPAGLHELVLSWQPQQRKLYVFDDRLAAFLDMGTGTVIHKDDEGWFAPEKDFRWTAPKAILRLARPPRAKAFEWKIQVPAEQLREVGGRIVAETSLDGKPLPAITLNAPGWKTVRTTDLPVTGEVVNVELRVTPTFRPPGDRRELGVAVGAIGFR